MDDAVNKNPYRCLPLSIANAWGWEILSTAKFTAEWDGGAAPKSVKVTLLEGHSPPSGYFGEGTLTWHAGYMFKTEYPYGMYVTGAPNYPKPNVIPLSGVVETHWLPFTFTMNWRFTQPGTFSMDIGEPFCQIFPVDMNVFDDMEAEIRTLHEPEAQELHDDYWNWNLSRSEFLHGQRVGKNGPDIWQRNYFQGTYPPENRGCPIHMKEDGTQLTPHRTKPNVPEFVDKQVARFKQPAGFSEKVRAVTKVTRKASDILDSMHISHPQQPRMDSSLITEDKILRMKERLKTLGG
jgi:hypothetical protein